MLTVGAEQWSNSLGIIKEHRDSVKYGTTYANNEKAKSCQDICNEVNVRFISEGDKKVRKTTLQRYVRLGHKSAKKRGEKPRVPMALLNAIQLYIKMKQLSRSSQATPIEIRLP